MAARAEEQSEARRRRRAGDLVAEHFRKRAARAITNRTIFRYLAGALLVLSGAAGALAWLVDRRDFHTLGDGLWWALVTLATVGYGDIVPHTAWGRVIGATVIVMGVTFLAILTATVTSHLVSADQDLRRAEVHSLRSEDEAHLRVALEEIADRLDSIEEKLERRDGPR